MRLELALRLEVMNPQGGNIESHSLAIHPRDYLLTNRNQSNLKLTDIILLYLMN
jgi:hypothetical protein